MTNIEKVIIGMIATLVLLLIISVIGVLNAVEEEGGIRQAVVNAGKEIKSIAQEITDE